MKHICLRILKNKILHLESYLYHHFVLAIKLLSGVQSQICVMPVMTYWQQTNISQTHYITTDTLEVVGIFSWSIEKMMRALQIEFLAHNTMREGYIKVTIPVLVSDWCQAISCKSKCQIWAFPLCFPNIPFILPVLLYGIRACDCWSSYYQANLGCIAVNKHRHQLLWLCKAISAYGDIGLGQNWHR